MTRLHDGSQFVVDTQAVLGHALDNIVAVCRSMSAVSRPGRLLEDQIQPANLVGNELGFGCRVETALDFGS
jgi:hypothetical protein